MFGFTYRAEFGAVGATISIEFTILTPGRAPPLPRRVQIETAAIERLPALVSDHSAWSLNGVILLEGGEVE